MRFVELVAAVLSDLQRSPESLQCRWWIGDAKGQPDSKKRLGERMRVLGRFSRVNEPVRYGNRLVLRPCERQRHGQ